MKIRNGKYQNSPTSSENLPPGGEGAPCCGAGAPAVFTDDRAKKKQQSNFKSTTRRSRRKTTFIIPTFALGEFDRDAASISEMNSIGDINAERIQQTRRHVEVTKARKLSRHSFLDGIAASRGRIIGLEEIHTWCKLGNTVWHILCFHEANGHH